MKFVDEFRNRQLIKHASEKIFEIMPQRTIRLMEVCGTHTQSFRRFGLGRLIPKNLSLISGPGCPVCVSGQDYIDRAVQLSKQADTIIVTFGDMLRVPGTDTSLQEQMSEGADVRIVYSAWEALNIASSHPNKQVVFLAVGFETTAPTFALTLQAAKREKLNNLLFYSDLKLIPPAIKALVCDGKLKIDGFLCPGHVSAVIGSQAYEFIPQRYGIPCCVTGFEPLDMLEGIYLLLEQITRNKAEVKNQYVRAVKRKGNPKAKEIIKKVFKISNAAWRGLGRIPSSGLELKEEFANFDAKKRIMFKAKPKIRNAKQNRCRCGDVLKGAIQPDECPLFRKTCTPTRPYGPCMVSSEGACNAYYRYK